MPLGMVEGICRKSYTYCHLILFVVLQTTAAAFFHILNLMPAPSHHIHIHVLSLSYRLLRIISLDEALGMSRGAPSISAQPKIQSEDFPHGTSTDDQEAANHGANIPTYDDPPLEQLPVDEIEDGSFSVEENAWRGEDPPEEVPHDEYASSEYEEDMPDDEMASRAGEGHQEMMSDEPLDESPSEDPTRASDSFDARGGLEHQGQGDSSTIGTREGGDEEATQVTQGSRASRGTRGSLAASLKERYRGKRSPGIRMPPSSPTDTDGKSGSSIGASSTNSPVNGISVDTPRFSDGDGYSGVDSPGFSDNTSNGSNGDGCSYQENDRHHRRGDTTPFSGGEDTDEFASPRSESQFSPQSDFTDGDELMSPLGSPTGQARNQDFQRQGNDSTTPSSYELGESPQPSPSVAMSPSDAGSYTDGSYTTDASSMVSADANPSTRRALILQMAKARMNSGKRREEEELAEENGTDADTDDDSELKGQNDWSMTRTGHVTPGDAVEMARARSPGGSVDEFEGVTGDLD